MNFWSNNPAAPTWLDTWDRDPLPSYLRSEPAAKPVVAGYEPQQATVRDAGEIVAFWNTYYRGEDWKMNIREAHIVPYLEDPRVYAFVIRSVDKSLLATIFSVPCSLTMSHGAELKSARVIEGLCVHPSVRKVGIAGLMIAYADWFTSQRGPVCHIWAREERMDIFMSTAISCRAYSYTVCNMANHGVFAMERVPYTTFVENVWKPLKPCSPYIKNYPAPMYRNDIDIWATYVNERKIHVAVTNTRRITKTGSDIYEILWTSDTPSSIGLILDSISTKYNGLLYTTINKHLLSNKWHKDTSGYHAYYIYNFKPPIFSYCDVSLLREEL